MKENYNKIVKCPCYEGDGYGYSFDRIDFNFCEVCNGKLLKQMIEQWKLERELMEENKNEQED